MKILLAITSAVLIGVGVLVLLVSTLLLIDSDTRDSAAEATLLAARTSAVNQLGTTLALTGGLLAIGAVLVGRSTRGAPTFPPTGAGSAPTAAPVSALQPVHPAQPAYPQRPSQ